MELLDEKKESKKRRLENLKLAFSEFYLALILLQNYWNLNLTGFEKILKKHDKLLGSEVGATWKEEQVERSHFHMDEHLDKLVVDTEAFVTTRLEEGNRQNAMKRLRVPQVGDYRASFKLGLLLGVLLVLTFVTLVSASFFILEGSEKQDWKIVLRLFRGPFLVLPCLDRDQHVLVEEIQSEPRSHLLAGPS